jgi:recombinational DNA repair ATPase RecF
LSEYLSQRINMKYTYMKSEYNKVKKQEDLAERQAQAALEALEDEVEEVAEQDVAYRSQMKSRVKAVSEKHRDERPKPN